MACLLGCLALNLPLRAQEPPTEIDLSNPEIADLSTEDSGFSAKNSRVTLAHEGSYGEHGVVNNRSWFRVEYSKFFLNNFFVQLDSKVNAYWSSDHRAEA